MPTSRSKEILGGSLGEFWLWDGSSRIPSEIDTQGGYLDLDEGRCRLQVLMTDAESWQHAGHGGLEAPNAIVGLVPSGTTLITGIRGVGTQVRFGPAAASRWIYVGANVASGIPDLTALRSANLKSASIEVPDLVRWAGLQTNEVEVKYDSSGHVDSAEIRLLSIPAAKAGRVHSGLRIEVDARWNVARESEQQTIETVLVIKAVATTPAPSPVLANVLQLAQYLLVFAYRGWVLTSPGRAELDLKRGSSSAEATELWLDDLQQRPSGARVAELSSLPYFTLQDLGGASGLARWIKLCMDNRRVLQPLIMFHRNGQTSVEDHLIAMCAASEYLVASRSKQKGWLDVKGAPSGGIAKIHTMMHRVGRPWAELVGDTDKWADLVWRAYNDTKHYRRAKPDIGAMRTLASSMEILLTCVLLDEAAQSKKVSRRYLSHHTLHQLRSALRRLTT